MVSLAALWLPILVSAVAVFIASSIIHMVLTYHRSNYRQLPDEENLLATLRSASLTPGLYNFPFCTHKDMKSPATVERFKQGPVGFMTIFPTGPVNMGKFLGLWFAYCLVVGIVVAFLAGTTLPRGAEHHMVVHTVGLAALLAYGIGGLSNGIWKGQPWSMTLKEAFDGFVYALLTGFTFGWLWPQ
jgi:hypothetical protein